MSLEDELRRIADALAAERAAAASSGASSGEAVEQAVAARLADAEARGRAAGHAEGYAAALATLDRERDISFVEGREAGVTRGRELGRSEGWEAGLAEGWATGRQAFDTAARSHADRQDREAVALDRLARALRLLDRGGSLTEILDALAASASQEAARIGVLLVSGPEGDRELSGWRFIGFDREQSELQDAHRFRLPLRDAGLIADAVSSVERIGANSDGTTESDDAGEIGDRGGALGPRLPAFARLADESAPGTHRAVAVPLTLGGTAVGVLYGDLPSESPADASWAAMLEILARHASGRLEAITALRVAQVEEQTLETASWKLDTRS